MNNLRPVALAFLVFWVGMLSLTNAASGQTLTWSGSSSANGNSTNGQNWLGGVAPPGNADRAFVFDTQYLAGSNRTAVIWATGTSGWTSLTLAAGSPSTGFTLGGSSGITLKGPVTVSSGAHLFRTTTTLSTDSTWNVAAGATLTRDNDNALTLPANVKITKTGVGELAITGTNNSGLFLGTVEVQQGILKQQTSSNTLGSGTLALNGGTFLMVGNATLSNTNAVTRVIGDSTVSTDRGAAGAGIQMLLGSLVAGANKLTITTGTLVTSGTQEVVFGATTLTGAATFEPTNSVGATTQLTLGAVGESGGAFGLTKSGNGLLVLSGSNSYSGGTTINAGSLSLGNGGTAGSLNASGAITIASGATLIVNRSDTLTLANVIAGAGTLQNSSAGTLVLTASNTYTGTTTVALGTLQVQNSDALGASGAANKTVVQTGARVRLSGTVASPEPFDIAGNGVGGTGAINVNDTATDATLLGRVTLTANAIVGLGNGQLKLSGGIDNGGFTLTCLSSLGGILQADTAAISGLGGLTKTGTGTLVLAGANTYSGTTAVSAGTLIVANGTALGATGAGTTVASGAQLRLNAAGGITVGAEPLSIVGQGPTTGGALRNALGNNTWQGPITLTGSATIGAASGTKLTLDVAAGNAITAANFDLTFDGAGANEVLDPIVLGTGGVTKIGSGTTTLAGANSYSGATTVSVGTLLVNGSNTGGGAVTVASGATLGGSGNIDGAVAVSGVLSPGNSPGLLTLSSLVLNSSATTLMEINGTTRASQYDGIDLSTAGGLSYGGNLSLVFGLGAAVPDQTTFDLFNFAGTPTGDFTGVTSTGIYAGSWSLAGSGTWTLQSGAQTLTFSQATGDIIVVPEPAGLALASLGIVGAAWLCRKRG